MEKINRYYIQMKRTEKSLYQILISRRERKNWNFRFIKITYTQSSVYTKINILNS